VQGKAHRQARMQANAQARNTACQGVLKARRKSAHASLYPLLPQLQFTFGDEV
jgi:hypothetical protein